MKKISCLLIILTILLIGCSQTKSYDEPVFNGSDYVLMKPGTTYHYKRVATKTKDVLSIDITINNCNKNKTKCVYSTKITNSDGKVEGQYNMDYLIKDGAVHMTDNLYKNGTILLPAKLELNKEISLVDTKEFGNVKEKLIVHKQIPKIKINNNEYLNCINIIFETITPTSNEYLKIITNEVTCKNIGTVKKILGIYSKPKIGRDVNGIKYTLSDTYLDVLESISFK